MKDIADAAAASVQTVYTSVGSKSRLVLELNDHIDEEAGVSSIVEAAFSSTDADTVLSAGPRVARALIETCGDIIRVATEGARYEPELARVVAEGQRRHLMGVEGMMRKLHSLGALAPGTDLTELARRVAPLTDVSLALLLVENYGWTPGAVEAWMAERVADAVSAAKA